MMQRVCEKCGHVIEKPTRKNIMETVQYYTRFRLFKSNDEYTTEMSLDLCNRCRDEFEQWLFEPPKEG